MMRRRLGNRIRRGGLKSALGFIEAAFLKRRLRRFHKHAELFALLFFMPASVLAIAHGASSHAAYVLMPRCRSIHGVGRHIALAGRPVERFSIRGLFAAPEGFKKDEPQELEID